MVLPMIRPLLKTLIRRSLGGLSANEKEEKNASNDAFYMLHLYLTLPHLRVLIHVLINFYHIFFYCRCCSRLIIVQNGFTEDPQDWSLFTVPW